MAGLDTGSQELCSQLAVGFRDSPATALHYSRPRFLQRRICRVKA
jgi:hypothetical protein